MKNKDVIIWILSIHATVAFQLSRRETFVKSFLFVGSVFIKREKRQGKDLEFFLVLWNTNASVGNIVSIFKATWICLLNPNTVPQNF